MKKEIIISRMYSGGYLRENLGHEIINLFKSDNGKNYIYLNDVGTFSKEHINADGKCSIESILLVRTLYGANTVEILGVAKGLSPVYNPLSSYSDLTELNKEQKHFVDDNNITYGGAKLYSIFSNEPIPGVYITFEAEQVLLVNKDKHIYIRFAEKENTNPQKIELLATDKLVELQDVKLGHELKSYIAEDAVDYSVLSDLVADSTNWGVETPIVDIKNTPAEQSLLAACKMENDEVAYSNAIAYFAQKYPALTQDFGQKLSHLQVMGRLSLNIERETGHTDILLYGSKQFCIIENKIKSGINGIEYDESGKIVKTQLDDYIEFSKKFMEENSIKASFPRYYLLVPDYHPITRYSDGNTFTDLVKIGNGINAFKVVKYSQLYSYLLPKTKKAPYKSDASFKEFVKSLEKHTHTYDESVYDEMYRRFYDRIMAVTDWR